ncbi:hypothetical protein GCM10018785_27320 [Streptomyces longispororuber]|uniref:Uncharacterized protein n=1 Tax=Streptomyces longispororuber TaxID=68230 RepID=A0A918ZJK6_9ACTN|nr:hypothetical protein [Streptomyces longispororuber]GHE56537.1 hypothetical protein GCM10018785_27320 [Streptomyces longispororuber]
MQTPDQLATSYAQPSRRRAYVTGMRQLAAARPAGQPVRIYLSAPPAVQDRPTWPHRVDRIRDELPDGIELVQYRDVFDPAVDYFEQWAATADTFDSLVVIGLHRDRRRDPREQTLGPIARQELIHTVSAGKPVLLHSPTRGLVPVLDCKPRRVGAEPHQRLRLTIPPGWSPAEPTLQAALAALTPRHAGTTPQQRTTDTPSRPRHDAPVHLAHPFSAAASPSTCS